MWNFRSFAVKIACFQKLSHCCLDHADPLILDQWHDHTKANALSKRVDKKLFLICTVSQMALCLSQRRHLSTRQKIIRKILLALFDNQLTK